MKIAQPTNQDLGALLILAFACMAIRLPLLGHPALSWDEGFYLLAGRSIVEGALPYVDIWDRKPLGLFLIYAAAEWTGSGMLAYQVLALVAVIATSWLLYRLARDYATFSGAIIVAVAYSVYLSALHCWGGQSPVFYNAPVALAALLTWRAQAAPSTAAVIWGGAVAMAAMAVAIQIKYTVVFEGVFFGLMLMISLAKLGMTKARIMLVAMAWIAIALSLTSFALGYYSLIGRSQDYIHANFVSIFLRDVSASWWIDTAKAAATLGGFAIAAFVSSRTFIRNSTGASLFEFAMIWAAAAIAGFLIVGPYGDHVRAPLLLPFAVLAAPALGLRGRQLALAALVLLPGIGLATLRAANLGTDLATRQQVVQATVAIQRNMNGGCLFVYEGLAVLYYQVQACTVTAYKFPSHLHGTTELDALPILPAVEVTRVFLRQPQTVVALDLRPTNSVTANAIVLRELSRDYRVVEHFTLGVQRYAIYRRMPWASARQSKVNLSGRRNLLLPFAGKSAHLAR